MSEETQSIYEECPDCGASVLEKPAEGKIICRESGKIIEDGLKDRGPEWRAYSNEEKKEKSRAGPTPTELRHDNLSTRVSYKDKDSRGKNLSPEERRKAYRLRKWNKRSRVTEGKDRSVIIGNQEIKRMSSQLSGHSLNIPKNVQKETAKLFKEASKEDLLRGRSIEGSASALLHHVLKRNDLPVTYQDIQEVSPCDKKEISRIERQLSRKLGLPSSPLSPEVFVPRYSDGVGVPDHVSKKAKEIERYAEEEDISSGKSPSGIAASAVYIASMMAGEDYVTQVELSDIAGITEVTLRDRYREIAEELDLEVNPYKNKD
ncbi:MAG: transcription initiation factor IIB [Candidatus Aenigmatarchaeota archaeon]